MGNNAGLAWITGFHMQKRGLVAAGVVGVVIVFSSQYPSANVQEENRVFLMSNVSTNPSGFPTNQSGQTVGSGADIKDGQGPQLIEAFGSDGTTRGYVKATDLEEPMPSSPEEAANNVDQSRRIPLYSVDGLTRIGDFDIHRSTPGGR